MVIYVLCFVERTFKLSNGRGFVEISNFDELSHIDSLSSSILTRSTLSRDGNG